MTNAIEKPVKELCVNCHFFIQKFNNADGIKVAPASLATRKAFIQGDIGENNTQNMFGCKYGVWDFDSTPNKSVRLEMLRSTTSRKRDDCFFWPHKSDMLFPAAEILQERAAKDREAAKDRKYTRYGLAIAAIALVVQCFISIVALICQVFFDTLNYLK